MTSTRKIFVDSKDRVSGTSTDFQVRLQNPVEGVTGMILADMIMPVTMYNINSVNNTFYFSERIYNVIESGYSDYYDDGSNQFTVTVSAGNYSVSELMSALKTAVDNEITPAYCTITYSSATSKFTFTVTDNGANLWNYSDDAGIFGVFNLWDEATFEHYHPNKLFRNSLNYVMGFYEYTIPLLAVHMTGGNVPYYQDTEPSFTSSHLHNVLSEPYLYLLCQQVHGAESTSDNNSFRNILHKVPITSYYMEVQFSSSSFHQQPVEVVNPNFGSLDFRLVDSLNRTVDLYGGEFSFSISIFYNENNED